MEKLEQKYYTPTIDEFHVGFEFEGLVTERGHQNWSLNDNLTASGLSDIVLWLSKEKDHPYYEEVRVKYLDQEDIESLGFKFKYNYGNESSKKGYDFYFRNLPESHPLYKTFNNTTIGSVLIVDKNNSTSLEIYDVYESNEVNTFYNSNIKSFKGTIKNKSELIKILKMLGV
jgi:hypothetical protein